jgi:DNA repair protein RadD
MATIVELLRRLDIGTLEQFAGATIVRAVRSVYNVNLESALAQLVADKFGGSILENREIRHALLDTLSSNVAEEACRKLGIPLPSNGVPAAILQQHFHRGFTGAKAEQFVDLFALPPELVPHKVVDTRAATFLVAPSSGEQIRLRGFLHPFQKRVKDAIIRELREPARRTMVQMPTGAGKTLTALEAVVDVFRLPFRKEFIVWLVDSNELAEQALEAFTYLWRLKGDHPLRLHRLFAQFEPDFSASTGGMVFASFDKVRSVLTNSAHAAFESLKHLIRNTTVLIVDEAHTSVAETYETCIRAFINNDTASLLGISATPGRNDQNLSRQLARLYSGNLISLTDDRGRQLDDAIAYLQSEGFLARLRTEELETQFEVSEAEESLICRVLAENSQRNEVIVDQIALANEKREPTLVFACTKDHVLALIALCRARGISAEFITGDTPQAQRVSILSRFRKGEVITLINLDILSAGVDLPNVSRMIITRPIGSAIMYSQILGRALRGPRNGGNAENVVVNIRDNLRNFPSANFVYQGFQYGFSTRA